MSKLSTFQSAVQLRITSPSNNIAELKDHISIIYDEKEPTREEWTVILLLQLLADGEYEWLRSISLASSRPLFPLPTLSNASRLNLGGTRSRQLHCSGHGARSQSKT